MRWRIWASEVRLVCVILEVILYRQKNTYFRVAKLADLYIAFEYVKDVAFQKFLVHDTLPVLKLSWLNANTWETTFHVQTEYEFKIHHSPAAWDHRLKLRQGHVFIFPIRKN